MDESVIRERKVPLHTQWCVHGLEQLQAMAVTEDGEVCAAIPKSRSLRVASAMVMCANTKNVQLVLWFGKHLAHVLNCVWLALWITLQRPQQLCLYQCTPHAATLGLATSISDESLMACLSVLNGVPCFPPCVNTAPLLHKLLSGCVNAPKSFMTSQSKPTRPNTLHTSAFCSFVRAPAEWQSHWLSMCAWCLLW